MGKKEEPMIAYYEDARHFAWLVNGWICQGEKEIDEAQIKPKNPAIRADFLLRSMVLLPYTILCWFLSAEDALLHLGIKNIRLGPTLPAFIPPNILNYLVESFRIAPITTPKQDLADLLR